MTHVDRTRAEGFGAVADRYDRVRPSYPERLLAELVADTPSGPVRRVLDVGCGTGKVARLLARAGCEVLGVEPDARMAAVAAAHGLQVEVAHFERWDPAGRAWDLLTAGQSWHWVDPVAGSAKALDALRPGGRFAAFWNRPGHLPEVAAMFAEVYGRRAPELLRASNLLGTGEGVTRRAGPSAEALAAAGFVDVQVRDGDLYRRTVSHTPDSWVELAATHSDHAALPAARRRALLGEVRDRLSHLGPTFPVRLRTDVVLATRP